MFAIAGPIRFTDANCVCLINIDQSVLHADATWFRMCAEWMKKRQGNGCYALEYLIFGNASDDRVRVQKLKDS